MKQLRIFSALLMCLFALSFSGCSKEDDTIGGTGDGSGDNGETTEFYRIPKEELQDWSDGIYSNDGYMLASYDSISNNKHYYIADKENKGFYFLLNEKNEVIEIGNGNKCANIIYSNEGCLISYFDANGVLNGAFIKKDSKTAPLNIHATRASNSDLFDDLGNVFDIMGHLQDAGTLLSDLINSDHYKFMQDFQRIGTDGIIGLLPNPLGASILTLKSMLEGMNDALYERQRKAMYGDCNIKIEEISNDGRGNINVFVTIDKANTIPSHLYHLYYTEPEEVTRNIVYWGVVGRRNSVPYINYYTEPYTSYEEQLDCTSSSPQYKMLTFEMPPKGDKYIFRAYLKSLRLKDSKNNVNGNHIKYSEKYEYSDGLSCPDGNHVHAVDLGLPSGLKWACCNVGAESPEEYGDYFAWGETTPKSTYTEENCKTFGESKQDICEEPGYDVAATNWGGKWCMPTKNDMQELIDNCTWTWTTQNGINGYKVTSKKNGNSIFLPAAGCRYGSSLDDANKDGLYWSSAPNESSTYGAYFLFFGSGSCALDWDYRYIGLTVRPVSQ